MAELTDAQRDTLIRTVLGEARGEGLDGMAAVAQVIQNRANSGRYPSDPSEVALQPYQFSTWNSGEGGNNPQQFSPNSNAYQQAAQVVDSVFSGQVPDRTNGALFYHTPQVSPNWANSVNRYGTTQLGNHIFYNGRPTPPGEIPNQVASWTDTIRPSTPSPATQSKALSSQRSLIPSSGSDALKSAMARLAGQSVRNVSPATQSPDLAQMRNPIMSSSARNAQVTPSSNVPLPRSRPSAPDIVTPSMAAVNAQRGNVNVMRGVDMLAATQNPVTPRLTAAGDDIYSYHIPDMTPTAIVGGIGSLTPSPARQRLPDIPRTIPGQSQIERAAANVRPAAPAASPSTVAPAQNMLSRDSVANAALGQRVATQMGQAFNPPENVPARLVPKPIVQPTNVTRNQPPIQVVPAPPPQMRSAPVPALMSQGLAAQRMPIMGSQQMGGGLPLMRSQPVSQSPLRVTVSGANSYSSPAATPVQSLQSQGLSAADAYALANQQSRERAYERVNGPDTRSDWFRDVTGG